MLQIGFLIVTDNRRRRRRSVEERYFSLMLIMLLLSFLADIASSLNHASAWFFPFAAAGNYIEIILNTTMLPIYYLYVCMQITNINITLKRRINEILWILAAVCGGFVISTAFSKLIFYYDSANEYHRGPLFWVPMSVLCVMMLIIEAFIVSQKSRIDARHFKSLVLFLIFPLIGWALQLLIYGLPFSLISATFAAQVVFTNIQNRSMDTDYLTGVFNRQSLDHQMQGKIAASTGQSSFSAILLDIDNFKSINDCFGHYEGDAALIYTADLLRSSVRSKDFIARYGGDEFCIIFDEGDSSALDHVIQRINDNLHEFNMNTKKPYQLNFSIGSAVYDPSIGADTELFMRIIDQRMYDEKKARKTVI
jgi:diguanylate cyclase (GGDEF)-like protein